MTFEIIPAHDVPLAAQGATFAEAFRGYVGGPVAMDAAALGHYIHAQGTDLCYSRFARSAPSVGDFAARAFASDRALAVISDPTAAGAIRIHAVSLRQALSAVLQRHFDREFFAGD